MTMTDRELLELAAKAAGLDVEFMAISGANIVSGPRQGVWNPLTDDGDALRLACDLRLKVLPGKHLGDGCSVEAQRDGIAGCTAFRDDARQQMRIAIVHVAAEIGKAMP